MINAKMKVILIFLPQLKSKCYW